MILITAILVKDNHRLFFKTEETIFKEGDFIYFKNTSKTIKVEKVEYNLPNKYSTPKLQELKKEDIRRIVRRSPNLTFEEKLHIILENF